MREFDQRTTSDRESEIRASLQELAVSGSITDEDIERIVPTFPLKVQLQTYTRCNAGCLMCPYPEVVGQPGFAHQRMSERLFLRVLDELSVHRVERLSLFLMNEPLLDKRLVQWIRVARQRLPNVTLGLFTNGSPLVDSMARRLAQAGLDELCVSFHGLDRATYETVMAGLSYERARTNLVRALTDFEEGRLGSMRVQVIAGDIPELRGTRSGVDRLIERHTLLKSFSNERTVANVSTGLPSALSGGERAVCQRPFVKLYILTDGRCVLCNCDWRKTVVLGRVTESGRDEIRSLWTGPRYREIRRRHLLQDFRPRSICAGCDYPSVADHG